MQKRHVTLKKYMYVLNKRTYLKIMKRLIFSIKNSLLHWVVHTFVIYEAFSTITNTLKANMAISKLFSNESRCEK